VVKPHHQLGMEPHELMMKPCAMAEPHYQQGMEMESRELVVMFFSGDDATIRMKVHDDDIATMIESKKYQAIPCCYLFWLLLQWR